MRKVLLIAIAALMITPAAHAQTSGYIGLFAGETRDSWCGSGTPPYPVEMYIWCLPSVDGMRCGEFMIAYPSDATVIPATTTPNPELALVMGSLPDGVSACYAVCKNEWNWLFHQTIYVTGPNQNLLQIVENPESNAILFSSCVEPDRPVYDAIPWTNLYLNYVDGVDPECSQTATREASWGAIKSMY